uniref:Uncharacterized protein n=1 Tax=Anopheles farauti TaxID=69004 RepID=A0A182QH75_9DIPT
MAEIAITEIDYLMREEHVREAMETTLKYASLLANIRMFESRDASQLVKMRLLVKEAEYQAATNVTANRASMESLVEERRQLIALRQEQRDRRIARVRGSRSRGSTGPYGRTSGASAHGRYCRRGASGGRNPSWGSDPHRRIETTNQASNGGCAMGLFKWGVQEPVGGIRNQARIEEELIQQHQRRLARQRSDAAASPQKTRLQQQQQLRRAANTATIYTLLLRRYPR